MCIMKISDLSITPQIMEVLLLICLADMPYGYYQLVRFVSMVVFVVLAHKSWRNNQHSLTIVFVSLALLFQPFVKIALGRTIWNIVDVVVAIGLIVLWMNERRVRGGD